MSVAESPVAFLPREEIERRAADLRREGGVVSIPVDPVALAEELGISVYLTDFDDPQIVGLIHRVDDGWEILLDDEGPPARALFTAAHELGHYALHLGDGGSGGFTDTDAQLYRMNDAGTGRDHRERGMEIQANMFAAALLMPEPEVRAAWASERSVQKLAKRFHVSRLAMRYRVDQLGLW